jgi:putative chitinase
MLQLTGRVNYKAYGDDRGRDFLTTPTRIATDPALAVDSALWYWNHKNINSQADADNVTAVTKLVNGGNNHLDDRKAKLARAKCLLLR